MHQRKRRANAVLPIDPPVDSIGWKVPEGGMRTVASPPESPVKTTTTVANAAIYVLSGCSQPLLMVLCRNAGLADPSAQFYMLAYYLGPALVIIPLLRQGSQGWPSRGVILKGCGISIFDICAQSMNYTGASLAGPTERSGRACSSTISTVRSPTPSL